MTTKDISDIRLASQQISTTECKTVKELVSWMGAMQAQDYAMCKWAVGARLPNVTDREVQDAIDKGEIIRTHILRPTWHLVSADDIHWMLELTAPQIKQFMKSNNKLLGLTDDIFKKSHKLIEKSLSRGEHFTRDELTSMYEKAKIPTHDMRLSHLLVMAELEGIICSGCNKSNKQTYALLHQRVSKTKSLAREEALEKLARRYFMSHGPATLTDFIWWSGLLVKDAKHALELIKDDFISEEVDGKTYLLHDSFLNIKHKKSSTFLLPAFDEFLISYKDRTASISTENMRKAFTNNGIFWPVIVVDGQAVGVWKRSVKKDQVLIDIQLFKPETYAVKKSIYKQAEVFAKFLGKKLLLEII